MKRIWILLALSICLLPQAGSADDADKERIKELEKKMAELEKAAKGAPSSGQAEAHVIGVLFGAAGTVNPAISNAILIIEGDQSVGTGFLVSNGGKNYVYTAAHVFSGNSKLSIRNSNGASFKKFGFLEAAEGADLVRMEVFEEVKDSLQLASVNSDIQIMVPIAALGNGGGNGVVSVERGKILGTSGDILEVDAGIIQGNSGGPVVEQLTGKVLGLVTHLTSARKDAWSEGTRQGEIRRFACRLNKEWKWKTMKIGTFLADGKALADFDQLTKISFAMARLQASETGLRMDIEAGKNTELLEILQDNRENDVVKSLIQMNSDLASRKTSLSDAELKKKFRSLLSQIQGQAIRSTEAFKPQNFAWFHRTKAQGSLEARRESIEAIRLKLDRLK